MKPLTEAPKESSLSPELLREAQGQPWLLDAIIRRELAVDELVEAGGAGAYDNQELLSQVNQRRDEVDFRKGALGLPEYPLAEPSKNTAVDTNR